MGIMWAVWKIKKRELCRTTIIIIRKIKKKTYHFIILILNKENIETKNLLVNFP